VILLICEDEANRLNVSAVLKKAAAGNYLEEPKYGSLQKSNAVGSRKQKESGRNSPYAATSNKTRISNQQGHPNDVQRCVKPNPEEPTDADAKDQNPHLEPHREYFRHPFQGA
jgi:hypothetical protein